MAHAKKNDTIESFCRLVKVRDFFPLLKRVEADGKELLDLEVLKDQQRMAEHKINLALLAGPAAPRIAAMRPELEQLLGEINNRLERYHFIPGVRLPDAPLTLEKYDRFTGAESFKWECLGAKWLVELATNGSGRAHADILKFRNCQLEDCGQLFYDFTNRQKFCSPKCCRKAHFSSERFKKKRAAYMRNKRREQRMDEAKQFERNGTRRFNRRNAGTRKRRMIQ
jgi:hypothetical protein